MFEKGASIECNFDWWPKFQVFFIRFLHETHQSTPLTPWYCFTDGNWQTHLKTIVPKSRSSVWWEIVFGNCDKAKMISFIVYWVNWSMTNWMICVIITTKSGWRFQSHSIKRSQTKNPSLPLPMNRSFVTASITTSRFWKHTFDWTSIWINATPNGRRHINISKVWLASFMAFACWIRIPWRIYSHSYAAKTIIYRGIWRFYSSICHFFQLWRIAWQHSDFSSFQFVQHIKLGWEIVYKLWTKNLWYQWHCLPCVPQFQWINRSKGKDCIFVLVSSSCLNVSEFRLNKSFAPHHLGIEQNLFIVQLLKLKKKVAWIGSKRFRTWNTKKRTLNSPHWLVSDQRYTINQQNIIHWKMASVEVFLLWFQVADCICLMSLDHLEAIPVDTHVLKIALQHYLPKGRDVKSMTPKLYNEIGDAFRDVYGPLAGYAQTVLFCADLAKFKANESNNVKDGCSTKKKRKKA